MSECLFTINFECNVHADKKSIRQVVARASLIEFVTYYGPNIALKQNEFREHSDLMQSNNVNNFQLQSNRTKDRSNCRKGY